MERGSLRSWFTFPSTVDDAPRATRACAVLRDRGVL
jgi:hypothetical protein